MAVGRSAMAGIGPGTQGRGFRGLLTGLVFVSLLVHGLLFLTIGGLPRAPAHQTLEIVFPKEPQTRRAIPVPPSKAPPKAPPARARGPVAAPVPQVAPAVPPEAPARERPPVAASPQAVEPLAVPRLPEVRGSTPLAWVSPPRTASSAAFDLPSVSAGAGTGTGSGTAKEAGTGEGAGANARGARDYLDGIRAKIEGAKRYPPEAVRRRQEGRVVVRFVITAEGELGTLELVKRTPYRVLDEAALAAVRRAAPFGSPMGNPRKGPMTIEIPIVFQLT